MDEAKENIFIGKTVEEAVAEGLKTLGVTAEQVDIEVLEEGRRKLIGSIKAKVKLTKKLSDGERAAEFIDGLMKILKIPAFNEVVSDDEKVVIEIKTTDSSAVIGRKGEVLDAIQCIAGAVANIGREEYRRVVVDCENYRTVREEKLKSVAIAEAKKAAETKRRVSLEPMSPYERRIVHSVLADNEDVTTISDGREPIRRVVIIPKDEIPYERRDGGRRFNRDRRDDRSYGERRDGGRRFNRDRRDERPYGERRDGGRRFNRDRRDERPYGERRERREDFGEQRGREIRPPRSSAPRGKKQIYLGTYLGNSNDNNNNNDNSDNNNE